MLLLIVVGLSGPGMCSSDPNDSPQTPDGFDVQGHRGARGLAPENTIPAFRTALQHGVTTLEMDVVLSGDGTVVVSHEPWMAHDKCRTPDGQPIAASDERTHLIYEMTYEKVEDYDCGSLRLSRFPEQRSTPAPKPRLRDVIRMAEAYVEERDHGPVFYNVEVKSRPEWDEKYHPDPQRYATAVLAVISDERVAARTTIQSFDSRILEVVHGEHTAVRTAILIGAAQSGGLEAVLRTLSFVPHVYSPAVSLVDAPLVRAAHDRGMAVVPWTVNETAEMERLVHLGVDGLITDYPNRAMEVLKQMDLG